MLLLQNSRINKFKTESPSSCPLHQWPPLALSANLGPITPTPLHAPFRTGDKVVLRGETVLEPLETAL